MTVDKFLSIFEQTNRELPMTLLRDGYIRHLQEDTEYCPITAVASRNLPNVPIEPFRPGIFDAVYAQEWGILLGLETQDAEAIQMASDGDMSPGGTADRKAIRERLKAIIRSSHLPAATDAGAATDASAIRVAAKERPTLKSFASLNSFPD